MQGYFQLTGFQAKTCKETNINVNIVPVLTRTLQSSNLNCKLEVTYNLTVIPVKALPFVNLFYSKYKIYTIYNIRGAGYNEYIGLN